jgi:hypothetical protein
VRQKGVQVVDQEQWDMNMSWAGTACGKHPAQLNKTSWVKIWRQHDQQQKGRVFVAEFSASCGTEGYQMTPATLALYQTNRLGTSVARIRELEVRKRIRMLVELHAGIIR